MELYKRIRNRREELGMTQDELAIQMGYKSRSSINKIELGKSDIPQSKIKAFAHALKTTPEYLMGLEDFEKSSINETLEFFESLLDKLGYQYDEYIHCSDNEQCPLSTHQKNCVWVYSKEYRACKKCKFNKIYLYVKKNAQYIKIDSNEITEMTNKILSYINYIFSEKEQNTNSISESEYVSLEIPPIYSSYNRHINEEVNRLAKYSHLITNGQLPLFQEILGSDELPKICDYKSDYMIPVAAHANESATPEDNKFDDDIMDDDSEWE